MHYFVIIQCSKLYYEPCFIVEETESPIKIKYVSCPSSGSVVGSKGREPSRVCALRKLTKKKKLSGVAVKSVDVARMRTV